MFTTEELKAICEKSVVSYKDWNDRDSYIAQVQLNDLFGLLHLDIPYTYSVESNTIWVKFDIEDKETKNKIRSSYVPQLNIDSREDYFNEFGYDGEMFDSSGMDLCGSGVSFYLPTPESLEKASGGDWY